MRCNCALRCKAADDRFAINSKAAYFFIKEAALHIKPHSEGKIITIVTSLLAAFTGLYSTYAGAKAPVEHFCRAAAKELGEKGISVNNVGPGPMDTYPPHRLRHLTL
jgi:NAD(P)-dependent dehydrogenase (short-subunit alcohol dehydrogenase family)